MDQYFNQMDKIIKERKTSSRIRFMLQDVLDLRKVNVAHFSVLSRQVPPDWCVSPAWPCLDRL